MSFNKFSKEKKKVEEKRKQEEKKLSEMKHKEGLEKLKIFKQKEIEMLENKLSSLKIKIGSLKQPISINARGNFRDKAPMYYELNTNLQKVKIKKDEALEDKYNTKNIIFAEIAFALIILIVTMKALSEAPDILENSLMFKDLMPFLDNRLLFIIQDLLFVGLASSICILVYKSPLVRDINFRYFFLFVFLIALFSIAFMDIQ